MYGKRSRRIYLEVCQKFRFCFFSLALHDYSQLNTGKEKKLIPDKLSANNPLAELCTQKVNSRYQYGYINIF